MDQIFCGYYDEEMEQDAPLQPSLDEAIGFFKNFIWDNKNLESGMKIIFLQTLEDEGASLQISSLERNQWCVCANVSKRRRFLGPFFKRNSFKIFIDKNMLETESIIRLFYQKTSNEFAAYLQCSTE